jgi:hypothetical protein
MMSLSFGAGAIGKVFFGNNKIGKVYFGNTKLYEADAPYLTFASPDAFSIKIYDDIKRWGGTLEYSTDGTSWSTWAGTSAINAALSGGEYKLLMRGTNNTRIGGSDAEGRWVLNGSNIACIGNIENLLDYAKVAAKIHPAMATYCYAHMFQFCPSLTRAPDLPAMTLANYCYYYMFYNCTGLTSAPALPALTLANNCYNYMFYNCTGLTEAPALPALALASSCYNGMFEGCGELATPTALPATTLATSCYRDMFGSCAKLKVSATRTGAYTKEWRMPKSGAISATASGWNTGMLGGTGGTFTGYPQINTAYYVENDPVE